MAIEEQYKGIVAYLQKAINIIDKMGIRIEEFSQGHVKVRLPLEPNLNHVKIAYAGSLFSLADYMGGVLFFATFNHKKYYPILKEASIKYKRPGTTDITIEASIPAEQAAAIQKTADETGKCDFPLELELKDTQGTVCAVVNGLFQMRKTEGK